MSHSLSDTIPLHASSQSDIDEIEDLIHASPASGLPAGPPSPPMPATIPVSSAPFIQSNMPPPPPPPTSSNQKVPTVPAHPTLSGGHRPNLGPTGFGSSPNTLAEPVWDTVSRDLSRIVSNLKLTLSWSASVKKSLLINCIVRKIWMTLS